MSEAEVRDSFQERVTDAEPLGASGEPPSTNAGEAGSWRSRATAALARGNTPNAVRPRLRVVAARVAAGLGVLAVVTMIYLVVLVVGSGLRIPHNPPTGWVVVATIIVSLVVQPCYRAFERWWRRVLGGPALGPMEFLRRLPRTVVGSLSSEDIPGHMVRVLGEALAAQRSELWLRLPDGFYECVAVWPEFSDPSKGRLTREAVATEDPSNGVAVHAVRYGSSDVVGYLRVDHRPARTLSALERRLVHAYADQAGQVITMLARRAELRDRRAHLGRRRLALLQAREQLRASRDLERKRIEHDLHDGGQQHLLALSLATTLARRFAVRAPDRYGDALRQAMLQTDEVERHLADLSSNLRPRFLALDGLATSLQTALAFNGLPVVVSERSAAAVGPLPASVAEALFFVVLEATQNATKHSGASHVLVDVRHELNSLTVLVRDTGSGFDPERSGRGGGLDGMRRRLDGLGGSLQVVSKRGSGTTVVASVPTTGASATSRSAAS